MQEQDDRAALRAHFVGDETQTVTVDELAVRRGDDGGHGNPVGGLEYTHFAKKGGCGKRVLAAKTSPLMTFGLLSRIIAFAALLTGLMLLPGCHRQEGGPIVISAIGGPPLLRNPNEGPLDPPGAFLAETAAQGLV